MDGTLVVSDVGNAYLTADFEIEQIVLLAATDLQTHVAGVDEVV